MSEERRLLCLYPWLAIGGADKFNLDMLGCLAAHGWCATIVTTRPGAHPWRGAFERITGDIIDLTASPLEQYPDRLLAIIRSREVDCVLISHSSLGYDLLPYLRAHCPHVAFADYCHLVDPGWHAGGYPRMSLASASALDLQIVSSQALKHWMCVRGGEAQRIAVCTTNIDPADWDPARSDREALRAALGIPPTTPVVLYAARLERQKRPLLAMRIMERVIAQAGDTYCLIAGDGPFADYLRRFVHWHRLEERVRLLGAVSNQRMRELLALSDVFFLPSRVEGISLAIYEAMAMCTVPVSVASGGQAELVTPECGVLIPRGPGEQEQYLDALLRLVRDPELACHMGAAARCRVSAHFHLDQMGARMDALLEHARLLHRTCPRPPIDAAVAQAAAWTAVDAARRDARPALRRRLQALYWRLVARGAWWLVPVVERVRPM
jgi:glycosyltransferase involved in cell wall biosynthesis